MAKTIIRKLLTPFGQDGPTTNFAKFGSKAAGAPVKSKDIDTIQALPAWLNGLQDAVLGANHTVFLEDLNALFLIKSYMLAYLFQEGIAEWISTQRYFVGSLCRKPGTDEVYQSLQDDNIGQVLPNKTNNTFWKWFNEPAIKPGMGMQFFGSSLPQGNWLWQDGSAVSRSTYAALFAVIGTTYGTGNGSTTFNLPDMRSRVPMGAGTGPGLTGKSLGEKGGAESNSIPHNHGVGFSDEQQISTGGGEVQFNNYKAILGVAALGSGDLTFLRGAAIGVSSASPTVSVMQPYLASNWIIAY